MTCNHRGRGATGRGSSARGASIGAHQLARFGAHSPRLAIHARERGSRQAPGRRYRHSVPFSRLRPGPSRARQRTLESRPHRAPPPHRRRSLAPCAPPASSAATVVARCRHGRAPRPIARGETRPALRRVVRRQSGTRRSMRWNLAGRRGPLRRHVRPSPRADSRAPEAQGKGVYLSLASQQGGVGVRCFACGKHRARPLAYFENFCASVEPRHPLPGRAHRDQRHRPRVRVRIARATPCEGQRTGCTVRQPVPRRSPVRSRRCLMGEPSYRRRQVGTDAGRGHAKRSAKVQAVQGSGPAAPPAPIAAARMPLAGPGRYRQARESKGGVRSGVCARSMASRSCPERFELGAPGMPLSAPRRSRSRRHRCTRDTRTSHPGRGVGYGIGQSRRMTGKGLPAPRSAAATVDDPRLHQRIVARAREAKHFREGGNLDRPAVHVLKGRNSRRASRVGRCSYHRIIIRFFRHTERYTPSALLP